MVKWRPICPVAMHEDVSFVSPPRRQHSRAGVPASPKMPAHMARYSVLLAGAPVISMILACIAGAWADDTARPVQPEQRIVDCNFVSMSWKPQFGASHTVQASQMLPSKTVVSEDDSVVITVETTCDISKVAYASVMFTTENPLTSKAVLMKQGKSSKHLKGNLKATDLKPLGGAVTVTLSVGDANMRPMQWYIGSIGVLDRSGEILQKPPTNRHWAQFDVPPPLQHTFRPDQPSLPTIVPLIGSSFVSIPLFAFFYILFFKLNANVSGVADSVFSSLFMASITVTLCLGVWFWMRMKLVDLFIPLAGLALFMLVVGHQALRRIADKRLASEKESKGD